MQKDDANGIYCIHTNTHTQQYSETATRASESLNLIQGFRQIRKKKKVLKQTKHTIL